MAKKGDINNSINFGTERDWHGFCSIIKVEEIDISYYGERKDYN